MDKYISQISLYLKRLYENILPLMQNSKVKFQALGKGILAYLRIKKLLLLKVAVPFLIILIGFYSCASIRKDVINDVKELLFLSDELHNAYSNKPDFWGLSTDSVLKNNILSDRFILDNKIVLNKRIQAFIGDGIHSEMIMPGRVGFDVVISHLNKSQCISYAEVPFTEEELFKLEAITIINDKGDVRFEFGGDNALPIKRYTAKNFCSNSDNSIMWSFR